VPVGETAVKETAPLLTPADFAQLRERAQRAREEACRLSDEYQFIVAWYQMRPHSKVRPVPILDE